jgi:hypothetical protein
MSSTSKTLGNFKKGSLIMARFLVTRKCNGHSASHGLENGHAGNRLMASRYWARTLSPWSSNSRNLMPLPN